jgi:5-formyltetrahydrofolate cyclo-ligase
MKNIKSEIRARVWKVLEESNIARFPRPVYNRIPNFDGSDKAARSLIELEEFKNAKVIKINPDAPQRMVRYYTLTSYKTLIMPTPRLRGGFIILNPLVNPKDALKASTISGAFQYGKGFDLNIKIDAIIIGSVAVSRDGARLGKGEGYAELEYAILKEFSLVNDNTPIITSVHDIQIVDNVPIEEHDLAVDIIVTPTQIIRTHTNIKRPKGIIWDILDENKIEQIPLLKALRFK